MTEVFLPCCAGSKKVYSDEFKRKKEKQGAAEDASAANSTHQQVCFEEVRKKKQDWHTQKDSNPPTYDRAYKTAAEESGVVLPNGIPRTKRPSMPKGGTCG